MIDGINDALAQHALSPIAASERRGSHTIPSARMGELWQSPQAAYLYDALEGLSATWPAATTDHATRSANQRALTEFMHQLQAWSPRDERRASEYVHQRLLLIARLANLDASVRPHALKESIALLTATARRLPSIDWFAHLGGLLERAASPADHGFTLMLLQDSGHPVLTHYAQLLTLLQ